MATIAFKDPAQVKEQRKAYNWLFLHMGEKPFRYVQHIQSPNAHLIWEKLVYKFERSKNTRRELTIRWNNLQWRNDFDLFLSELDHLETQLKATGKQIDEEARSSPEHYAKAV